MRVKVNCVSYIKAGAISERGACGHQAAPRRLMGPACCIVEDGYRATSRSDDPRVVVCVPKCRMCVRIKPQEAFRPVVPQAETAYLEGKP